MWWQWFQRLHGDVLCPESPNETPIATLKICYFFLDRMLESTKGDVLFAILVSITYCSAVVDDAANLAAFSNETDTAGQQWFISTLVNN